MRTYLFYDLETSGLNKAFDQVMQFAAIRTDAHFNEIERHELYVKLNPDTVPSPEALLTHHISIDQCEKGMNEFKAIQKIHHLLNTPETISIGYNTLGFDDEFLRFSFYRNLLPPYTHQYANQCGRMDLYPMTLIYHLFAPDILTWPEVEGRPSMKLEHLSEHNQLATGPAHNAMVDVEATLALARRLRAKPEVWDYVAGYFDKNKAMARMMKLPVKHKTDLGQHRYAVWVEGIVGAKDGFCAPVLSLGQHSHYKNQTLWLRLDKPFNELTDTNFSEKAWVFKKKWGEPGFLLPPEKHYLRSVSAERQAVVNENLEWINTHPELFEHMVQYYRDYTYPVYPNVDTQAALYINGFLTPSEQAQCKTFRVATPADKAELLDHFVNPDLHDLAFRVMGRHYPDALSDTQRAQFDEYLSQLYEPNPDTEQVDYTGKPRLTRAQGLAAVHKCLESASSDQMPLLQGLEKWLNPNQ